MMGSLVKVTAWEQVSLFRRLLGALGRVSLLVVLLVAIGYVLYSTRYSIEARVWHWRHGYTTTVGDYEIPVPDHWLISPLGSNAFTLLNTAPAPRPHDGMFHTTAVIDVGLLSQFRPQSMDSWLSLQRQRLSSQKVESVEEKTVNFADESVTCIGGRELSALLRDRPNPPQVDAISLNCMSERGLNIMFVGEPSDVQPFYTFISQIRRRG